MSLNLFPEKFANSDPKLASALRAIDRHLFDDHYIRSISPGSMVLELTAAHAIVNSRWGVLSLPDGSTTSGLYTFERPSQWVNGKLKVTCRWSSPVASAATNFRIALQSWQAKEGSVMTGLVNVLMDVRLLAGPAVADTRASYSAYSSGNVTQEFDQISIRVGRTGGHADDTNVNDFHCYGLRVEFVPVAAEGHVAG